MNSHDNLGTLWQPEFPEFRGFNFKWPRFLWIFQFSSKRLLKFTKKMCSKNQIFNTKVIQQNKQLSNFYTGLDLDDFNSLFTYLQRKASFMQYFYSKKQQHMSDHFIWMAGVWRKSLVSPGNSVYERTSSVFCIAYRHDIHLKNAIFALVWVPLSFSESLLHG